MAVSKTTRFEVFKRDNFTCQYCGREAPEAVLEIDHIIPIKEDGTDDLYNLTTSCFDCNRGKKDKLLRNRIARRDLKKDIVDLETQRDQIKLFRELEKNKERGQIEELEELIDYWLTESDKTRRGSGYHVESTFKQFLKHFTVTQLKEAVDITYSKGRPNYFRYFCGICWNWIKRSSDN